MSNNGLSPKVVACSKFYRTIEEHDVDIEKRGPTGDGGIALEYSAEGDSDEKAASDISTIAGAFCGAQENGELGDLEATVYGDDGGVATWTLKSEWVDKFQAGEWDDEAVLEAVEDTLEVESQ